MAIFDYDNLILSEKLFGLEISDNQVRVLELRKIRGKYSVIGYGEQSVDPSAISDGVIINKELVAGIIKNVRENSKPKRIKTKRVAVVLPDSKVFMRVVKFPINMTKEEIKEAIEWKAKDLIAMPLDKVYWDWHRLRTENGLQQIEVVISAADKDCVDSYTQTLNMLGIFPLYYDVSGNAAARFLFQSEYKKKKALLIRIDRYSTTLSLFLKGGVRYQTIIKDVVKGGFNSLLDYTAARLGVGKDEAEDLIMSQGDLNKEQKELLKSALGVSFEGLLQEIRQILEYYSHSLNHNNHKEDKHKKEDFAGIYLYGKGAQIYYLKEFFEKKSIKVKNEPDNKLSLSPMLPFVSKKGLGEHMVLLGLSLRNLGEFKELRDINLVPISIKDKYLQTSIYSSLYKYLRMIFWDIFIIVVTLTFAFIITMIFKYNVNQELSAVKNIAESRANKQLRQDISNLNQAAAQTNMLFNTQVDWDSFFNEVSEKRGNGINYNNLIVSEDADTWKALSNGAKVTSSNKYFYLVVSGIASTREDLQRYTLEMESSEYFEEVKMPISNYELNENIEFTVYCLVNIDKLRGV